MTDLPIWSTDPELATQIRKALKAEKIAAEYGGTVAISWPKRLLRFNFPDETPVEDEIECVKRVTDLMEEDESLQGDVQLAGRSPYTSYEG